MKTLEDVFIDSIITTNKIMEDKEVSELLDDYLTEKINATEYGFKMMELALARGEHIKNTEKLMEAFRGGYTHADVKKSFVNHVDKTQETHIRGMQIVKDSTMDNAMAIPALEAIFSNANPEDYLNQVLAVAVHQAWVLQKIEASLKLQ